MEKLRVKTGERKCESGEILERGGAEGRRLVIFSSLPEVGGHTTTTLKLCEILRPMFGRVEVIVKDIPGHGFSQAACRQLESMGIGVTRWGGFVGSLCGAVKMGRRADVFLTIGMRHLSPLLALLLGARRSIYYHITHELSLRTRWQLRLYGCFFSEVVFLSPATARLFSGSEGAGGQDRSLALQKKLPRCALWVIQPTEIAGSGVGVLEGGNVLREPGVPRIGFLGRLTLDKGIGMLAEFVERSEVECRLVSAGRGEFEDRLRAYEHSMAERFEFLGAFQADERGKFLEKFFRKIDWLCVPSLDDREGIPNVIFEALQFGVPVLATRTGGMRCFEMPEMGPADRSVIRLVDPAELSVALRERVSDFLPDAAVARRCREYFESRFSDAVLAEKWKAES